MYWLFQFAAVVGVAITAVKIALVPATIVKIVAAPEDWTVTNPVLLLMMVYCAPAGTDVVGKRTVCVVAKDS